MRERAMNSCYAFSLAPFFKFEASPAAGRAPPPPAHLRRSTPGPHPRSWLHPAMRLAICLPPSTRSLKVSCTAGGAPGGGAARCRAGPRSSRPCRRDAPACLQVGPATVLEHPARPGLLGLLVDSGHVLLGTRVLQVGVAGLVVALPPLAALVAQAGTTLLTFNAAGFCRTQASSRPALRPPSRWRILLRPSTVVPAGLIGRRLPSGSADPRPRPHPLRSCFTTRCRCSASARRLAHWTC